MIWFVDDDGAIVMKLAATGSSPIAPEHRAIASKLVSWIIRDLADQGIETETFAILIREQRARGRVGVVWKARVTNLSQVADVREYFQRLSMSHRGD